MARTNENYLRWKFGYWVAAKLKAEKFHRIILELRDGREIVIDGLGQAVFPLLSFFWNKLGRYSDRAAAL